jgi:deoxyribonuclease-4
VEGLTRRIGAHRSVAESYTRAALDAHRIGGNTLQIFTSSPRMWRASMPRPDDLARFHETRQRLDLRPLAVHDNYLINLASSDLGIRARSIAAYRAEVERAMLVGADFLVAHPGSSRGQDVEAAMGAVARGLVEATRGLRSNGLRLLLENTAGQGAALGSRLEELAHIRGLASRDCPFEIGYCLDTAHTFASGHPIHTREGLAEFADQVEATLGWDRVGLIHCNDSKSPFDSRVDRHQHIGQGYIGEKAFARILQHPKIADKALILETPVEEDGDDARNISTLIRLCRKNRTTTARSS